MTFFYYTVKKKGRVIATTYEIGKKLPSKPINFGTEEYLLWFSSFHTLKLPIYMETFS